MSLMSVPSVRALATPSRRHLAIHLKSRLNVNDGLSDHSHIEKPTSDQTQEAECLFSR